jgi:lipid-A-disaccharide synthase
MVRVLSMIVRRCTAQKGVRFAYSIGLMDQAPVILFTAFEPSGDEHAAPVIAHLRRLLPNVEIHALGGPKMAAAGATIIEQTTAGAAMGASSLSKVGSQLAIRRRLKQWLDTHPVMIHVPTDSPAANWAFCKMVKRRWGSDRDAPGLGRVVHMVAPQVWAWAQWRVRRLQKWSDHVLCLLPFEVDFFARHHVKATFIGHPVFDHPLDPDALHWQAISYPTGHPRIALLPGSRPGEIAGNLPLMLETFHRLTQLHPTATAIIAAGDQAAADHAAAVAPKLPPDVRLAVGQTDAVLHWADVVLTASGTATLHVARHLKPMVILYRISPVSWHLIGRWLIDTRTFTLPNLIAAGGPHRDPQRHVVREFVPFLGKPEDVGPVVDELHALLLSPDKRNHQLAALRSIVGHFDGHDAGAEAARVIADVAAQSTAAAGQSLGRR